MELLFEVKKFLTLALHHTSYWYSSPATYHLCYIVGSNLFANHSLCTLCRLQLLLYAVDIVLQFLQLTISDFCHTLVVALTLSTLSLKLQCFHGLLVLLNLVHQGTFAFPLSTEVFLLIFKFSNLLVEHSNLGFIVLTLNSLALYLELLQVTSNLIKLLRHRVALHTQFCCSLVHKVDSLVRQEAVADVSL